MASYYDMVGKMAAQRGVDPALAQAVLHQESRGRPDAVSPVGAKGLMQTMPDTLRDPGFGVRPARDHSTREMARVGVDYLKAMLDRYKGDVPTALAAYNAGPGRADKYGADVPFKETQNYVRKIMADYGKRRGSAPAGNQQTSNQPSLADRWAERRAGNTPMAASNQPSLADRWAERKAARMATAVPDRGMDAFVEDAAKAMAAHTAPEQPGMMRQFAGGVGMGLADTVAGLDSVNRAVSRLNPLSYLPIVSDAQQSGHDAIQGAYGRVQDAYQQGGHSTPAGFAGRVAGNVASTAMLPGAAVRAMIPAAAGGVEQGAGVGAGVAGVAGAGAGVGALANSAKGVLPSWLRWMPAINIASKIAPKAGNVAGAAAPATVNGLLYTPSGGGLLD